MRCRRCSLVYTRRLPAPAELDEHYRSYPEHSEPGELTLRRFGELLDGLERFRDTGRLLDVGCGDGHFLAAAQERGWQAYGSEYGEGPRQRARERGLEVRPAPFEPTAAEAGGFDVVVAIEVIEHVTHPREEVERMRALLRRGGCVYLTTPNFGSISRRITGPRWRAIEYPEHLSLFTPESLDRLLASIGFAKLELQTTGISPSDIRAGLRPGREHRSGDGDGGASGDQQVRERVAGSAGLERAVRAVNAALTRSGLGDTIKALYQLT